MRTINRFSLSYGRGELHYTSYFLFSFVVKKGVSYELNHEPKDP